MTTAILGASDKPDRYSHRAFTMLQEHGHCVIPVHPSLTEIEGVPVVSSLEKITEPVDTLTLYLRPELSEPLAGEMIALGPRRVIFNPGTESDSLAEKLRSAGIETENACTLVLLQTGQF
jgi:predicted CoA-binding protein